ncbi:MAG: hypothetical protein Fur007_08850 [Rhodoferax sp.]
MLGMNWLNKLPGFQRTAYGLELRILRALPAVTLGATLIPVLLSGLARLYFGHHPLLNSEQSILTFDFAMVGLAVLFWTVALTLGIGCVIVWLMKGPAYVADAYPVSHSERPRAGSDRP